jgi:hypothetical protein
VRAVAANRSSDFVTKAEIIAKTLGAMNLNPPEDEPPFSDEQDEEGFIISVLQERLPEGADIKTCEDFRHLNVECCDTCHNFYPHYEMSVIDLLPDGGKAWVCDTVKWAIYPEKYRELQEWSRKSSQGKLLRKIFGEDVDE